MKLPRLGSPIGAVLAVFLLGLTAFSFWPFASASNQMRKFCSGLAAGTSFAAVQAQAAALDYFVSPLVGGQATVDDPRSFGRLQCELRFGPAGLISAE